MKFGVVVFPGSNCDADCYNVVKDVLGQEVEYIWHQNDQLHGFDCIIIPGGFSYGDYLRCGAIAHLAPAMEQVKEFANQGGLVIGICNGFQILTESGLLPGALLRNTSLKFICQDTYLRVENDQTPFTNEAQKGDVIKVPIAHGEGNYYCDEKTLAELEANNQIIFRYCDEEGETTANANPNGSISNIAGIINKEGNVLGMMPHPERCSEDILGGNQGKMIFDSIVKYLERRGVAHVK